MQKRVEGLLQGNVFMPIHFNHFKVRLVKKYTELKKTSDYIYYDTWNSKIKVKKSFCAFRKNMIVAVIVI